MILLTQLMSSSYYPFARTACAGLRRDHRLVPIGPCVCAANSVPSSYHGLPFGMLFILRRGSMNDQVNRGFAVVVTNTVEVIVIVRVS